MKVQGGKDFMVTVKLPRNPNHDPKNKVTGKCPMGDGICTDVTGEHHTILVQGTTMDWINDYFAGRHITRIEEV